MMFPCDRLVPATLGGGRGRRFDSDQEWKRPKEAQAAARRSAAARTLGLIPQTQPKAGDTHPMKDTNDADRG